MSRAISEEFQEPVLCIDLGCLQSFGGRSNLELAYYNGMGEKGDNKYNLYNIDEMENFSERLTVYNKENFNIILFEDLCKLYNEIRGKGYGPRDIIDEIIKTGRYKYIIGNCDRIDYLQVGMREAFIGIADKIIIPISDKVYDMEGALVTIEDLLNYYDKISILSFIKVTDNDIKCFIENKNKLYGKSMKIIKTKIPQKNNYINKHKEAKHIYDVNYYKQIRKAFNKIAYELIKDSIV